MAIVPKEKPSFFMGLRVMLRGLKLTAKQSPIVFAWINLFSLWFVGGGALMLALGSSSLLPLICVLTPGVSFPWIIVTASKYGYCRLLGLPRFVPWLVASVLAVWEILTGSYANQPTGYDVFLFGFVLLNFFCTLIDVVDVVRWSRGERTELVDTGFFQPAGAEV